MRFTVLTGSPRRQDTAAAPAAPVRALHMAVRMEGA